LLLANDKGEWFYGERGESLKKINFIYTAINNVDLLITSDDLPVIRYHSPVGFQYQYVPGNPYNNW